MLARRSKLPLARATALTLSASSRSIPSRAYAMPVNAKNSVDAILGVAPPPAPRPGEDQGNPFSNPNHRRNNPNDISELLRGPSSSPLPGARRAMDSGKDDNSGKARAERHKALGALQRRSGAIPTRDIEGEFVLPGRDGKAGEPSAQPVDREHPHPIDAMRGRNDLDERILAAARALHARRSASSSTAASTNISTLSAQFKERAGRQLSIELPYEPSPAHERRVQLTSALSDDAELARAQDDGILLIAYVSQLHAPRGKERIAVCSGFAVDGGERIGEEGEGNGALVISCAHTLQAAQPRKGSSDSGATSTANEDDSVAFAITRLGHVFPVRALISSLPGSDLIMLQLGEEAIVPSSELIPTAESPSVSSSVRPKTLPLSPYPAVVGTELAVSSFWGWEDDSGAALPAFEFVPPSSSGGGDGGSVSASSTSGTTQAGRQASVGGGLRLVTPPIPPEGREAEIVRRERDDAGRSRWARARLVEYKDVYGNEALTGTYDELSQLDFKLLSQSIHNPPALTSPTPSSASGSASKARKSGAWSQTPSPPGSSGGPIVDTETGAVVAITSGTKMTALEGFRGTAVPAEKVFEFFALPGMSKKH